MIENFYTWLIGGLILLAIITAMILYETRLGKPGKIGSPFTSYKNLPRTNENNKMSRVKASSTSNSKEKLNNTGGKNEKNN